MDVGVQDVFRIIFSSSSDARLMKLKLLFFLLTRQPRFQLRQVQQRYLQIVTQVGVATVVQVEAIVRLAVPGNRSKVEQSTKRYKKLAFDKKMGIA